MHSTHQAPEPRLDGAGLDEDAHWVHGWPFRLLLDHLAQQHRTSRRAVALAAGLSAGDARILMRCTPRWGRVPHRVGSALLEVDAATILASGRWLAAHGTTTLAA